MSKPRPLKPVIIDYDYVPSKEEIDSGEMVQHNYSRIEKSGAKEGMRVKIGSQFAHENDYEMFMGAEGYVYSIMQYDAQAIVALDNGKLLITQIEDCIPLRKEI